MTIDPGRYSDVWLLNEFLPEERELYENTLQSFYPNTGEIDFHDAWNFDRYGNRFRKGPIWFMRCNEGYPNDINGWDMVELYPSDEVFGVFAWSCSNVNSLRRMVEKHFEDEYVAEIEKLFVNY